MSSNNLPAQIDTIISQSAGQFVNTVQQYKWSIIPDSQLQAGKMALTKNDYIMQVACANPGSVHDSLMQAAILGLDLTEGKRQGWLLPRKSQIKGPDGKYITNICLQVGYKGVEAIHQRMGVIDRLTIRVVRERDIFTWSGNDQDKPSHEASEDGSTPNWFLTDEKRGPIKGAFSITYFPDGHIHAMVVPISVIYEKHRDRSESWKSYIAKADKGGFVHEPPWKTDEQSMVEKTMAFIAAKQWPANIRNNDMSSKILETLHEVDVSDYSLAFTREQKKAFEDFIAAEDGLGLYIFTQKRIEIETYAALHRSHMSNIERGQKGIVRKHIDGLISTGKDLMDNIIKGIEEEDAAKVIESLDGTLVVTDKLVKTQLSSLQEIKYIEMIESGEIVADK